MLYPSPDVQIFGFTSLSLINDNEWTQLVPDLYSWILIVVGFLVASVACSTVCLGCSSRRQKNRCFIGVVLFFAVILLVVSVALFVTLFTGFYYAESLQVLGQASTTAAATLQQLQAEYTDYIKWGTLGFAVFMLFVTLSLCYMCCAAPKRVRTQQVRV